MPNLVLPIACFLLGVLPRRPGRLPEQTPSVLNGFVTGVSQHLLIGSNRFGRAAKYQIDILKFLSCMERQRKQPSGVMRSSSGNLDAQARGCITVARTFRRRH